MNLKIISVLGILSCVGVPAWAQDVDEIEYEEDFIEEEADDETRTISARMTCAEINERIANLRDEVQSDPDLESELNVMLARQRTQCAVKSKRRPVRNYAKTNTKSEVKEETVAEPQEPELTPEEIAEIEAAYAQQASENIARGLCPDGAKPNRFGCCAGEKFTEVSAMRYACCPKEGDGECFEPLKK